MILPHREALLASYAYRRTTETNRAWSAWLPRVLETLVPDLRHLRCYWRNDAECYAFSTNHTRVYVFRGTESLRDAVADCRTWRVTNGPFGTRVHGGFEQHLNHLRHPLYEDAGETIDRGETCVCLGHSLGGGMATLWAAKLHEFGLPVQRLVTYGCPRVGGRSFAAAFQEANIPVVRYVNSGDPVPHVPLPVRFRHVSPAVYFDRNGEMQFGPTLGGMFIDRWRRRVVRLLHGKCDSLAQHSMRQYRKHIEAHSVSPTVVAD